MALKPNSERGKNGQTAEKIIQDLRRKTAGTPGVTVYLQSSQDLNIGGRGTVTQYQYTLTSDSLQDLEEWTPQLLVAMQICSFHVCLVLM